MTENIIDKIKELISIYDLFDKSSPIITYDTKEKPCQINCPFHGADLGPSARVFPETNSMYCWTCDRSWDVLDFWAEINGWFKDDSSLDISTTIKDLVDRFDIKNIRADWQKSLSDSLSSLATKSVGYSGIDIKVRETIKDTYSWMVSKGLDNLTAEERTEKWPGIKCMWDELDLIDLSKDSWKQELYSWMKGYRILHVSTSM